MGHTKAENAAPSDSWESLLETRNYTAAATLLRPLVAEARASYLGAIDGLGLEVKQAREQLDRLYKEDLERQVTALEKEFDEGEQSLIAKAIGARLHYVFLLGRLIECLFRLNENDEALALGQEAIEAGDPPFVCYEHCAAILGRLGQVAEIVELAATLAQEQEGRRKGSFSERTLFRVGQYAAFEVGKLEESLELARSGESWCTERGYSEERFGFLEDEGRTLEKMQALDDAKEVYRRAIAGPIPSTLERRWMYPLESIFKRYMILLGKEKGNEEEIGRVAQRALEGGLSAAAEMDARKRLARLEATPRSRSTARAAVMPFSVRSGPTPELVARKKRPDVRASIMVPASCILGGGSAAGFLSVVRPGALGAFQDGWELKLPTPIDEIVAIGDSLLAYASRNDPLLIFVDEGGKISNTYVPDGRIIRVAVGGEKVFVGSRDGSLTCLDGEAEPRWKHVVPGAEAFQGPEHFRPCPGVIDCTTDGERVAYMYATANTAFTNIVSLRSDSGDVEWRSDSGVEWRWGYDSRDSDEAGGLRVVVHTPDVAKGMAFAPSGRLVYNGRKGCVEFDAAGNVLGVRKIGDGRPIKDTSGRIRGFMYASGLTVVDDVLNPVGHVPCDAGWRVRVHGGDRIAALLDGKNILIASFNAEILAQVEFANHVNTFEWWEDDLLVSAGPELLWLAWEKNLWP